MEHLSEEELKARARDVFVNLITITSEAKIGMIPADENPDPRMERWTHILLELERRFGPHPAAFEDGFIKTAEFTKLTPSTRRAAALVGRTKLGQAPFLVKYGQRKHLEEALELNRLRVSPASSYDDPSLNHAIRDNELLFEMNPPPSEIRIQKIDKDTGHPTGESTTPISFQMSSELTTNYYAFCMSEAFDPRLFPDFGADACLIIEKPAEFISALVNALDVQSPGFDPGTGPVKYLDPLCTNAGSDIDLMFSKHFRFEYQSEFRIAWLPQKPVKHLEHLSIEVPDLGKYCRILHT